MLILIIFTTTGWVDERRWGCINQGYGIGRYIVASNESYLGKRGARASTAGLGIIKWSTNGSGVWFFSVVLLR